MRHMGEVGCLGGEVKYLSSVEKKETRVKETCVRKSDRDDMCVFSFFAAETCPRTNASSEGFTPPRPIPPTLPSCKDGRVLLSLSLASSLPFDVFF